MTASEHTELLPRVLTWTDKDPPGEKISSYTHVYADLAPFRFVIEWKGWKEPSDSRVLVVQWLDGGGQLFLGGHYSTTNAAQAAAEQWLASLPRPDGAEPVPVAWRWKAMGHPDGPWIVVHDGATAAAAMSLFASKGLSRQVEPLFASPTGMGVTETQASIGAWADETFGPVTDLPRAVKRAGEEMAELLNDAEAGKPPEKLIVEAADVTIVLMRFAQAIGQDLMAAVDAKMAINRAREWRLDGTGHGYHTKEAPTALHPTSETTEVGNG